MKSLNGSELAGFIKERQAKAVRSLRQGSKVMPRLAIIQCKDDPVINTYVRLKKAYGEDILVEVDTHFVNQSEIPKLIKKLNADESVHGIIVQLPLNDTSETDKIVEMVSPEKDVDALGKTSSFTPATPMAILWLLSGYAIDLNGKHVLLIGRGKLVGAPLERMLKDMGIETEVITREIPNVQERTLAADVIITATGSPAILYPEMVKTGAVIVDAGVASEDGRTVGDVHDSMFNRDDITITPQKGGVGPLTVCALFENVILAAQRSVANG